MPLKERLKQEQQKHSDICKELEGLNLRRTELLNAGVEIQGQIQLLNEMIAAETKPSEE